MFQINRDYAFAWKTLGWAIQEVTKVMVNDERVREGFEAYNNLDGLQSSFGTSSWQGSRDATG